MSKYEEIATLRDEEPSGVIATITKRAEENGYQFLSFAFFREYEPRPGAETRRTNFFNERHLEAIARLAPRVRERLQIEKDRIWEENRVG